MARRDAQPRSLGQRPRASVPLPWLAGLHKALGTPRRSRLGACARLLFVAIFRLQRNSGGAARPPCGARTRLNIRRVLMTADAAGGVWTYAVDLARSLASRDVQMTIALMGPPPSAAQLAQADRIDLRIGDFQLEWMDDPWHDVDRASEWLASIEHQLAPDVVHLNGYCHASIPFAAPKLVVAHSCVLSWWESVYREPAPLSWNEYRKRVSAGIAAADFVVAPTRAMLDAIEKHYGPLRACAVIPNGCDVRLFEPAEKERFVLTAGRFWDRAKNIALLERAASKIEWPVYAAGSGNSESTTIRALGQLPAFDLRRWFSRAAIYALPAYYEPFGLSILEAALSGCALVLGAIPSLRENWDNAAQFVSPDDAGELADCLRFLIRSDSARHDLQTAVRRRAEYFTLDRMTDAYLECYAALRCRSHPAA